MRDMPGIVFRDGPAGRRPAVSGGPDVWEIVTAVKRDMPAGGTVADFVGQTGWPSTFFDVALDYYSRFPDEIDDWIAENDRQAQAAFEAWTRRQEVLV